VNKQEMAAEVVEMAKEMDRVKSYDQTFTLTFGDQGENHAGMQKIGALADKGMSVAEILLVKNKFDEKGYKTEFIKLNDLLDDVKMDDADKQNIDEAGIVIVRNGLRLLLGDEKNATHAFFDEQNKLEKDKKAKMRGRVVNKNARYNLCFSDFSQKSDFDEGKGTVIDFKEVGLLAKVRENIHTIFGEKFKDLIAEGNYYYKPSVCGIGYHGDSERKLIVGVRVGKEMPLHFRWYHRFKIVSPTQKIMLGHGDVYFSSEKAVGFDWKKSSKYTLRHSAGCEKFLDTKNDM